jgi:hypothetical protein
VRECKVRRWEGKRRWVGEEGRWESKVKGKVRRNVRENGKVESEKGKVREEGERRSEWEDEMGWCEEKEKEMWVEKGRGEGERGREKCKAMIGNWWTW